eukprot:TRINITY_DN9844_c0_g1_i1.p1 TRINITY_DN9844_c0_g1~~TRINITY_DN9844_c0_g1_i1.p1  ORF type:complete len:281 (+),score=59.21 TRINITY_DN9844_c0_g1_i1:23-865(+)
MGKTVEYRIPMPLSMEEFKKGQLYMIARFMSEESNNNLNISIITNETYIDQDTGQQGVFTHKVMQFSSSLPSWLRRLIPGSVLKVEELSWNLYPCSRTIYKIGIFGDRCNVEVKTIHHPGNGDINNIFNLSMKELSRRDVDYIDIAHDNKQNRFSESLEDAAAFMSLDGTKDCLQPGWMANQDNLITAYKLVTVDFNYPGIRNKGQIFAHDVIRGSFMKAHRQAYCWYDHWSELSLEEIKEYDSFVCDSIHIEMEEEEAEHTNARKSKRSRLRRWLRPKL